MRQSHSSGSSSRHKATLFFVLLCLRSSRAINESPLPPVPVAAAAAAGGAAAAAAAAAPAGQCFAKAAEETQQPRLLC